MATAFETKRPLTDDDALAPKGHLLVVEDDKHLREMMCDFLALKGHSIVQAANGRAFKQAIISDVFDLILLDLNLPDADGLQLLQELRNYSQAPIFVVSGRSDEQTRLEALNLVVDDYIIKPFNIRELELRVRNFLKRGNQPVANEEWHFGEWRVDVSQSLVSRANGDKIALTTAEYELLLMLVRAQGKVLSREQITKLLSIAPDSLNVLVSRLRMKLNPFSHMDAPIITVPNRGYRISVPVIAA